MSRTIAADEDDSCRLRELIDPAVDSLAVYDADFPHEVGQAFVQAVATGRHTHIELDLTDQKNSELSGLIHEIASVECETVKFSIDLTR